MPALAASRRVFAPCLLGFGWSDKPLVEYDGYDVWPRQLAAFIREVGPMCSVQQGSCFAAQPASQPGSNMNYRHVTLRYTVMFSCFTSIFYLMLQVVGEPAVLVGNSLGGYAAMATAASHPDLVCPCMAECSLFLRSQGE